MTQRYKGIKIVLMSTLILITLKTTAQPGAESRGLKDYYRDCRYRDKTIGELFLLT
jgi:hypothetical protein